MANEVYLSIIVPVFNEEQRLGNLNKICSFLKKKSYTSEVIVVNDGSTDKTAAMIMALKKEWKCVVLSYPHNRGKGYAIRTGMLRAKGKYRLFMDVDLSVPLSAVSTFMKLAKNTPILIGTRKSKSAAVIARQSKLRERLGMVFTFLSQKWLGVELTDFTCGFKCFSAEAAQRIFSQLHIERWGYDAELLFVATKAGFKIHEVPVTWKNDDRTKVKFPQDLFRSLLDLLEIRYHFGRGRYF